MASSHPLNSAVVAQALYDIGNGQMRRCQTMGFTPIMLEALKHPEVASLLIHARVSWCSVRVNSDVAERLLERAKTLEQETETIDRLLRLGASTEMLSELHGLAHQEVAARRVALGLPQRKGRWPILSEAQETALWKRWSSGVKSHAMGLQDIPAMLALSIELAEEQALPLAVVWSAIRCWIEQGLT